MAMHFLDYVSMYFAARKEGYSRRQSFRVSLYGTPIYDLEHGGVLP